MAIVEQKKAELKEKKATENQVRYLIYPEIYKEVDYDNNKVELEISIPGVKKEAILLKTLSDWFHISAVRDEIEYRANASYGVEIVPGKTTAEYSNGLLKVHAVIRNPLDDAREIMF
jgi:HSP20 family molecular chaperone IbpA